MESTDDVLKRLRLTFNAALARLAQQKQQQGQQQQQQEQQGGEGNGSSTNGSSSSSGGGKPLGNGFVEALGLLKQVDVLLQELRDRQEAEERGKSRVQWQQQQQQQQQRRPAGGGAAGGGRGRGTRMLEAWEEEVGRNGRGRGNLQAIDRYLNALEQASSSSGHTSSFYSPPSSFSFSPTSPPVFLPFLDPNACWLQALASPAAGIRDVGALRSALEASDQLKDIVFAGPKGHNGKLIARYGSGSGKNGGELWKAEVHLTTRLTLAERARASAAAAAMGATLFPLLLRVTLVGNKDSAWSERVEEETKASLLRWREWTKDDVVKTVAAVLEELRMRVQPGARCDLTGRALKLDGALFEPMPPYSPCSSSSSGSGVAYRLRL